MSDITAPGGGNGDGRELVAGTLRGYRTWRLVPRGAPREPGVLPLASVTRPQVTWRPTLSASCTSVEFAPMNPSPPPSKSTHRAPARECHCGIYAWYAPADARTFSAEVFGVVQASGLVMLGTSGFHSRFGYLNHRWAGTQSRRAPLLNWWFSLPPPW